MNSKNSEGESSSVKRAFPDADSADTLPSMLVDQPAKRTEDDLLDRTSLVRGLCRTVVQDADGRKRATEVVVGLTGPWGSGKSSVLYFLEDHLSRQANVAVVRFNPWLVSGRDDLLLSLLGEMQIQLGRSDKQFARTMAESVHKYRKSLAPFVGLIPVVGSATAEAIRNIPDMRPRSPLEERKLVEDALRLADGAVVVLVDEFDRLEPGEMKATGQALRAAMDLPNISWVIALDAEKVIAAFDGTSHEWALGFLAKVLQITIPLRPLHADERQRLLDQFLKRTGHFEELSKSDLYPAVQSAVQPLLVTPRDIKRAVSTFSAMHGMVGREVHPCDILVWAALATSRPDLQRRIADQVDQFVNDPPDYMMQRTTDLKAFFGESNYESAVEAITYLFPRFRSQKSDNERFGRLQFWHAAWAMVWLGDPPFNLTRKEIEAFWNNPSPESFEELPVNKRNQMWFQITRLMPDLDDKNDLAFWEFMIYHLFRGVHENHEVCRGFMRASNSSAAMATRMKIVFESLRKSNDLALVPHVVRLEAARLGIGNQGPRPDLPEFLSEQELRERLPLELAKWKEWLKSGGWLRPPYYWSPLWGLLQLSDPKDVEELRSSIQDQLSNPQALASFAAFMVRGRDALAPDALEQIVSTNWLVDKISQALEVCEIDENSRGELKRLRWVATGNDLMVFPD